MIATYNVDFSGYWPQASIARLPAVAGIYCVYACRAGLANRLSIQGLIYIGESVDVRSRIAGHEKWSMWRRYLKQGEQLCFSVAKMSAGRERAEAALIYRHEPPANEQFTDNFPYQLTHVTTTGCNRCLESHFSVSPTRQQGLGLFLNFR